MENPSSSSWDTPYNSVNDPYRVDRSTTFSPPPPITDPRLEPVPETNDLSLSDLLPEFFKEEPAQAQPGQDKTFTYEFNPAELDKVKPEEPIEPSLPPSENSHIYAWLTEQEQAESQEAETAERKKLLIRVGAIAAVVGAVALLLIINVLAQPKAPAVTSSNITPADPNLYPGAIIVEAPAKLNDGLRKAFLEGQQPAPSSVEATYYLTSDPATKGLEFYNRAMTARGYQKQVAIDQFLNLSSQLQGLNARGISYTNATRQGYAMVAIPVTAALATSLGGNAKAGDTLLALVSIKS